MDCLLQSELGSHKKHFEERLSAVAEEHNAELARIDSKAQTALHTRASQVRGIGEGYGSRSRVAQLSDKSVSATRNFRIIFLHSYAREFPDQRMA